MTEQPSTERLPTQGRMEQAIREAHENWEAGNCHEPGCGCLTEYMKAAILPVHREELAAAEALLKKQFYEFVIRGAWKCYAKITPEADLLRVAAEEFGQYSGDSLARHDQELTERVLAGLPYDSEGYIHRSEVEALLKAGLHRIW